MNFGEKIVKYRKLRGLTQKELGVRVGFSEETADSRIRKYEKNIMKPKMDMRIKLANALDVDLSALSDFDIRTNEDIMRMFFQLEENIGIGIENTEDKIYLTIDKNNNDLHDLITYLETWYSRRQSYTCDALVANQGAVYGDGKMNAKDTYENWKAKFPHE